MNVVTNVVNSVSIEIYLVYSLSKYLSRYKDVKITTHSLGKKENKS